MTVLLMLLFIITALAADAIVQWKKKHEIHIVRSVVFYAKGILQEMFDHDGDLLPTMADGGTKIKKEKKKKK